jgi:hypothetical protein
MANYRQNVAMGITEKISIRISNTRHKRERLTG